MDMSKPLAHIEAQLEELKFKKIDHYRKSQDHKLQGDLYQEVEFSLRDVLDHERDKLAKAAQPTSTGKAP